MTLVNSKAKESIKAAYDIARTHVNAEGISALGESVLSYTR
jgi:hypothetical protein